MRSRSYKTNFCASKDSTEKAKDKPQAGTELLHTTCLIMDLYLELFQFSNNRSIT